MWKSYYLKIPWSLVVCPYIRLCIIFVAPLRQEIVEDFPVYKTNFLKFCFIAVFNQLGNYGPIFALSIIPVLVEAGVNSTQPIFVAFYGFILAKIFGNKFRENLTKREVIKKITCFILITIGVMMVV